MDSRGAVELRAATASPNVMLHEQVTQIMSQAHNLQEGLDQVRALLAREDRGWGLFGELGSEDDGMSLDDLKNWSNKIRPSRIGAPWIGRGFRLRQTFIWQDNIRYGGIPEAKQGRKSVQAYIDLPQNQEAFFSHSAHMRREGCLYHDGLAVWIGEDTTKELQAIPLAEITDIFRNPKQRSQIWAFKREWSERNPTDPNPKRMVRWYFTNRAWANRVDSITNSGNQDEEVSKTHRAFFMTPNTMEGYALGSPDAIAAFIWNSIARDAYMDGVTMNSAMATFAFKASVGRQTGADAANLKFASPNGAGSTAITGATNDLTAMPTAGKGYDFQNLRSLTAVIAASLDVSNIALTADVALSGGGYGSASTLDTPTRLAMESRRLEHSELDVEVLKWMGAPDPTAYFRKLTDPTEVFREAQALLLLWSSGLYATGPIEKRLSELMQIIGNTVPDGVLIPNNEHSWERSDIDPSATMAASISKDGKPTPSQSTTSTTGKPNATPVGQGKNSPAGKGLPANDIRTEFLQRLEKFGQMIEEMEALSQRAIAA